MTDTARAAFFEQLRRLGLTTVFGKPGSTEETMLADFPGDFRYVLGRQGASVVAMADGYARPRVRRPWSTCTRPPAWGTP